MGRFQGRCALVFVPKIKAGAQPGPPSFVIMKIFSLVFHDFMMIFMMIFGLEKKLGTNSNRRTAGSARPLNQSAFLRFILRRQNAVHEMLFKKCFSKNGFLKNADAFFDSDFAAFHGPANHNIWVLFRPKNATYCGNLVKPHNVRLYSLGRPILQLVIQGGIVSAPLLYHGLHPLSRGF